MKKLIFTLILFFLFNVNAATYFSQRGSARFGGYLDFAITDGNVGLSTDMFANFFITDFFMLGPSMGLDLYEGSNWFELGPVVGFAYGRNMPVIPFAEAIPLWTVGNGNLGFAFDFGGGILIPVKEHISIDVKAGYRFDLKGGNFSNRIYVLNIGLSALIF